MTMEKRIKKTLFLLLFSLIRPNNCKDRKKKKGKEKSFSFHQILRKKTIEKSRIKERLREIKREKWRKPPQGGRTIHDTKGELREGLENFDWLELQKSNWCKLNCFGFLTQRSINFPHFSQKTMSYERDMIFQRW